MTYTASRRLCLAALVVLWGAVGVKAQEASPDNYDYSITTDKATYAPDEQVVATVALVTRAADVQAWSFGVANGAELALASATAEGTDAGGLAPDFLAVTAVDGGFFGSAILSTGETVAVLPDASTTSLAIATYDVAATACDGQDGDITSALSFSNDLGAPPVDTVVVVGGTSVTPTVQTGAEVTIACMMTTVGLSLSFDATDCDLVADQTTTLDLKVLLSNAADGMAVDAQGWSYGVAFDASLLEFVSGSAGEATATLGDGTGPDFASYQAEVSEDGTLMGVTVGVVLELDGPDNTVLTAAPGATSHIDTLTVKSAVAIAMDGAAQTADVSYTDQLGGDPQRDPIEVLIVAAGASIIPDFAGTKTVNLLPGTGDVMLPDELALIFVDDSADLVGDGTATVDVPVSIANGTATGVDVQAWSYGVAFDTAVLELVMGAPGADAAALNGGMGPAFASYDATDGGAIVGVILSLEGPEDPVIAAATQTTNQIDTLTLKSAGSIATDTAVTLSFSSALGDPVTEVVLVAGGLGVDGVVSDDTETINVTAGGPADAPLFIRSDANNDGRPDIADGIWIINELFYQGDATACLAAADANADGSRDLTDAMFIFSYWLQPAATADNLFPAPSDPFPNCGTAEGVTFEQCAMGSTTCM